ncbi:hypothetical protein C8F01DRAFT_774883 [Mycena amicta]|nr:hypothetical protein C8F01DRAFT_774883 [Mycena amicta]
MASTPKLLIQSIQALYRRIFDTYCRQAASRTCALGWYITATPLFCPDSDKCALTVHRIKSPTGSWLSDDTPHDLPSMFKLSVVIPTPYSDSGSACSSPTLSSTSSGSGLYVPVHRRQNSLPEAARSASPVSVDEHPPVLAAPGPRIYSPAALLRLAHSPLVDDFAGSSMIRSSVWRFNCEYITGATFRVPEPKTRPHGHRGRRGKKGSKPQKGAPQADKHVMSWRDRDAQGVSSRV